MLGAKLITFKSLTTTKATFRENSFIQSLQFSFLPFLVFLFGYNFSFKSQNNVPSILQLSQFCNFWVFVFLFCHLILYLMRIRVLGCFPSCLRSALRFLRVSQQPQDCFTIQTQLINIQTFSPNFMVDSNNHSCEFKEPRLFFLNKHILFLIMNKTHYELIFSDFFFSVFNLFVMKLFPLISLQKTS